MKTKSISIILIILLVLQVITPIVFAETDEILTGYTDNGVSYSISNGEATITGYAGGDVLDIPEEIQGYPVTKIGTGAFATYTSHTSKMYKINFPKTLRTIETGAFYCCQYLEEIVLPEGVESIEDIAFAQCWGVSRIILPKSVKQISSTAFSDITNVIYGYTGSFVEEYAENNNFIFKKRCTVIFKDYDDTILKEGEVLEGESAIPPTNPTRNGYKFDSWDYDYTNISEDITINAKYKKLYTVTFKDYDESIIKTEKVADGESAEEPDNPTRNGYKFVGWDKEFDNITENTEITAKYKRLYKVTFKDYDGTILKEENVVEGESAIPPSNPTKDGYIFVGWNKQYTNINEDITIEAEYRNKNVYKVIFKDYDGTVLKEDDVIELDSAIPPEEPSRDGYRFIGWDRDFSYITDNTEIIANFVKVYTVTFKDYDGRIVKAQEVTEGQSATKPSNPTRLGYTFSRWEGIYTNVHNDTIVKAVYTKSSDTFEVGKRKKITLTASNVSYSDAYYNATWRIDDSNIATILSQGKSAVIINSQYNVSASVNLQGISYGSTYLRLYSNTGTVLKTCVVSVVPSMDDISSCNISVKTVGNNTYTGNELRPSISISNSDGVSLIEGEDYTVEYLDNINAGTGTIVISGIDSYVGIVRKTFTINPKNISTITSTIDTSSKVYNENEHTTNIELLDGEKALVEGTDYTVEYENNINAGTATVTVIGTGNYTGVIKKYFTIKEADIEINYEANNKEVTYNGDYYGINIDNTTPNEAIIKYADKSGQYVLDEMPQYNTVGTYNIKFRIYVDENHTDIKDSRKLVINPKNIKTIDTIEVDIDDKVYSNSDIYTTMVLKDSNKLLKEEVDYTVEYIDNKNVGRTSICIRGKGNYTGDISKSFNIIPNNISNILVKVDTNNKTYTGKTIKTNIKLTDNSYTLKEGKDYTVTYKNNTNIGTATVTITGKGNFIGSIIKTFTIIPKKVTLSSVKNVKTKAAKITWKKDTKVTGYEIYMATSKNGKYTRIKAVTSNKTVTYTKKKLKKNKKYYFMVRSYKTVNGKKIYGEYSSKKYVKVKK